MEQQRAAASLTVESVGLQLPNLLDDDHPRRRSPQHDLVQRLTQRHTAVLLSNNISRLPYTAEQTLY